MEPQTNTEENLLEATLSLQKEMRNRQTRLRSVLMGNFVLFGVFFLVALMTSFHYGRRYPSLLIGQLYGTLTGGLFSGLWFVFFDKKRKKQVADYKSALLRMAGSEDARAVGLLLEEVYHYDFALRQEIRAALTRLLPRLQAENAPALNEHQRKTLTYLPFLISEINPNLRLAALQAIAQAGNAEMLRIVKQNRKSTGQEIRTELAAPKPYMKTRPIRFPSRTETAYIAHFQSAVEDCITDLGARLARENAAGTLLRAARSENAAPETLLRPAASAESDNAELLRPASDGE